MNIPNKDRLIFALDVPTTAEAKQWIERLGDSVSFYKLGMELLTTGDYFELIDFLVAKEKKVFADVKFYDVPRTVAAAMKGLHGRGIEFVTIHGDAAIMQAAAEAKGDVKILAVTVLTSLSPKDAQSLVGNASLADVVLQRAQTAAEYGCDGVVCSGLEVSTLRSSIGDKLCYVTPGIRNSDEARGDQKRVVTAAQAFASGADYVVVGRPIRAAADPAAAAMAIQATIKDSFSSHE